MTLKPSIHTSINCSKLHQGYNEKGNSGFIGVVDCYVVRNDENSFEEVEGAFDKYTDSLYYHVGFRQCINCWKSDALNSLANEDYMTNQQLGEQHESDLFFLDKYFKSNPGAFEEFHDLI